MPYQGGLPLVSRGASLAEGGDGRTVPVNVADSQFSEYEPVAASQTGQVIGDVGAIGDYIDHIVVIPATLAAGSIALLDGATSYSIFVAGTLSNLVPFAVPLGIKSKFGAWSITTGANVSCLAAGKFS